MAEHDLPRRTFLTAAAGLAAAGAVGRLAFGRGHDLGLPVRAAKPDTEPIDASTPVQNGPIWTVVGTLMAVNATAPSLFVLAPSIQSAPFELPITEGFTVMRGGYSNDLGVLQIGDRIDVVVDLPVGTTEYRTPWIYANFFGGYVTVLEDSTNSQFRASDYYGNEYTVTVSDKTTTSDDTGQTMPAATRLPSAGDQLHVVGSTDAPYSQTVNAVTILPYTSIDLAASAAS